MARPLAHHLAARRPILSGTLAGPLPNQTRVHVHVNWDLRLRACPQAKHEATATHAGVENFLKKALVSPVLDLRPTSRPSAT